MLKLIHTSFFVACLSFLVSCGDSAILDTQIDMVDGVWHVDSLASFQFEIEDTATHYWIDYNVRYAVDYPYYNMYVKYYLEDSAGTLLSSDLQEIILFDKKLGTPQGEGLGDLFDKQMRVFEDQKFDYQGAYSFKVKQFMRMETLPGVMSFGIKIQVPEEE